MGDKLVKALIVSSVYGFLSKFERQNVELLEAMNIEVHFCSCRGASVSFTFFTSVVLALTFLGHFSRTGERF